jgi:electron transfer flavoprotein alpha subunit
MATHILIVSETIQNKPAQPIEDLVRFAKTLSSEKHTEFTIVMAGQDIRIPAKQTAETTGINVTTLEDHRLLLPNPELLSKALLDVIKEVNPDYIFLTHTPRGCLTAAKLSQALKASCITNVDSLYYKGDIPMFRRSIFNGKFIMEITDPGCQTILTVIPGACKSSQAYNPPTTPGKVISRNLSDICNDSDNVDRFIPVKLTPMEESDNALEEAEIIISVGMGMENIENVEVARKVASLLKNATIGASRIACDMGWLSHSKQIGETGKRVAPKLYLACGISGSAQHVAGIKNAQMIIAINKDPRAAIFSVADYGIVEDLNTFLPLLVEKLQQD